MLVSAAGNDDDDDFACDESTIITWGAMKSSQIVYVPLTFVVHLDDKSFKDRCETNDCVTCSCLHVLSRSASSFLDGEDGGSDEFVSHKTTASSILSLSMKLTSVS
jgi:hypothetical protein